MQTESISGLRSVEDGSSDAAAAAAHSEVYVEQEFLVDRFSLRAHFDWKVARRSLNRTEENADVGVSTIFRAPSERVFTRDGVIEFLGRLRKRAGNYVPARHASTPQVWVFREGHHTWVEQDASIAPWRYMYFMGPRMGATSMEVAIQTRKALLRWLPWLTRTRTIRIIVESNDLVIFPSVAVQSMTYQPDGADLVDQTLVLSGWLW